MFKKYQHVERSFQVLSVQGLFDSEFMLIQPKLDGSNCSMWYEDSQIHIASRNDELSYHRDNQGCYNTLINDSRYKDFFVKYPNIRLYGEWLVRHSIQYEETAYRKFYIFDAQIDHTYLDYYYEVVPMLAQYGIHELLPTIKVKTDELITLIDEGTIYDSEIGKISQFLVKDNKMGEGLVFKNYEWAFEQTSQGRHISWLKTINGEVFKGPKKRKEKVIYDNSREAAFLKTIDNHTFSKEYYKIENFENKDIGTYIRNCQTEIFEDFTKDHIEKESIIDWNHKAINNLIAKRSLEFIKEIKNEKE